MSLGNLLFLKNNSSIIDQIKIIILLYNINANKNVREC